MTSAVDPHCPRAGLAADQSAASTGSQVSSAHAARIAASRSAGSPSATDTMVPRTGPRCPVGRHVGASGQSTGSAGHAGLSHCCHHPPVPASQVFGHCGERRVYSQITGTPRCIRPHPRGSLNPFVAQDAGVVVQHLDEDIAPEPAQPLAIFDHGDSADSRLVSRLERPPLRACNGNDPGRRAGQGKKVLAHASTYEQLLAVSLQPLRHAGARDEAARLIRRNILQQVLVEVLG
jgi:hypothetical protein